MSQSKKNVAVSSGSNSSTTTEAELHDDDNTHIMTVAEIKNHRTFRPIRELILKIVDNQIGRYKKIGNGEIAGESESDEDPDTNLDFEEDIADDAMDAIPDHEEEEDEEEELKNVTGDDRILTGYKVGIVELRLLEEKFLSREGFLLKFELLNGDLLIRAVPGTIHEFSTQYINAKVIRWSSAPTHTGGDGFTLDPAGSSDYVYRSGRHSSRKQPDASFIPAGIQVPPALIQPGTSRGTFRGIAFPTFVVEVGHCHETWDRLLRDADEKAFSPATSVQLVLGIKIYSRNFKAFVGKRHSRGHGMQIMRVTPRISFNTPTRQFLLLPTSLIYWSCLNVPPHVGRYFRFNLEEYRAYMKSRTGI